MSQCFAFFEINPVQKFITAAKRTQDFWAASFTLSYLSAVAMATMEEAEAGGVLYPDFKGDPLFDAVVGRAGRPREHDFSIVETRIGTLPNVFVARHDDPKRLREILKLVSDNVHGAYEEMVRQVKTRLETDLPGLCQGDGWAEIWERQRRYFVTFWAMTESEDGRPFGETIRAAARRMGARDGMRLFKQIPGGEPGRKCTLCGEKEPLKFWDGLRGERPKDAGRLFFRLRYASRRNERLCAPCTVKRLAPDIFFEAKRPTDPEAAPLVFPSTSAIAVAPALCRLARRWDDGQTQVDVEKFITFFQQLELDGFPRNLDPLPALKREIDGARFPGKRDIFRWDGDAFIEDTYQPGVLRKLYGMPETVPAAVVSRCGEQVGNLMADLRPSKYFAVVMMDGDNMGKHLAERETLAEHREISRRMARFSRELVPRVTEDLFRAKVPYFGGDEGVVFVALEDLFPLMRHLRAAFSGQLTHAGDSDGWNVNFSADGKVRVPVPGREEPLETLGPGFTACAGAVVAHHQHSLVQVMETVQETLEERAKELPEKNGFAIALMKRSGGTTMARSHWSYAASGDGEFLDVLVHLEDMAELYRSGQLTDAWLYDLDREKIGLISSEGVFPEIRRLIRRHTQEGNEEMSERVARASTRACRLLRCLDPAAGENALAEFIRLELAAAYIAKGGGS
ncbi:MAG: Cas10/Cmr2 second palm domain-containing protein [Desulfococcaceae bacterium]